MSERSGTLGTVLRHEWRLLRADRAVVVVLVLFIALAAYALATGERRASAHRSALERVAEAGRRTVAELRQQAVDAERRLAAPSDGPPEYGPRDPEFVLAATRQRNVVLPPSPHEALAVGRTDLYPDVYSVMTLETAINPYPQALPSKGAGLIFGRAIENVTSPRKLLVGPFDLLFLMVYGYPLLIIALTYNLLATEREEGTLALVLAQPIRLRTLVAAKIALRGALIVGLALLCPAIGIAAATGFAAPGDGTRLLLWTATVVLYGACWLALAAWVNASGRGSAHNAMVLAALWIVLVVVLPSALTLAATELHPVPPRIELVEAARRARNEARVTANEEALRRQFLERHRDRIHDQASIYVAMTTIVEPAPVGNPLLDGFLARHPKLAGDRRFTQMSLYYLLLAAQEEAVERRTEAVRGRIADSLDSRRAFLDRWAWLAPASLVQRVLRDAAGTGEARYRRFFDLAAVYQAEQRAFFWPRVFHAAALSAADHDRLPTFTYVEEPAGRIVRRSLAALATLAAFAAVGTSGAVVAFRRFGVV